MTPETIAQVTSAAEFAERYPAYREAREHAAGIRAMLAENATLRADKARLEQENTRLTDLIEKAYHKAAAIDSRLQELGGKADSLACDLNLHKGDE